MQGLACPRCFAPLSVLQCNACSINYSQLGATYWMWSDPVHALLDWRNRFNFHLAKVEAEQLRASADEQSQTRDRSSVFAKHLDRYADEIRQILAPFNLTEPLATEVHSALKTQLPDHHGLDAYNPNIFRDWVWGDEENNATSKLITDSVEAPTNPRVLVLGAGAGRLAYDLHDAWHAKATWSLDSNPLLAAVASHMFAGDTLALTEFPLAPRENSAIQNTLCSPGAQENLHSVCGSAMAAPFAANTFDIVVTSWLIDVIDAHLVDLLENVSSLLKPSGLWVNHGSLNFEANQPSGRLTPADLSAIAFDNGFNVLTQVDTELPYLQSPHSRQKRFETTHTLIATIATPLKTRPKSPDWVPTWLNDPTLPVPLAPEFETQITSTRVANFIMGLIDGKSSINEMAAVLEEQRLMPKLDGLEAIRSFLRKMHNEGLAQQRKG